MNVRAFFRRHRELILYVWFGGWTTVVNYASYLLLADLARVHYLAATALAWALSVLFAYLTNRKWVFRSQVRGAGAVLLEALAFFGSRGFSGLLDFGLMYLCVSVLALNGDVCKLMINLLVIVLNFVLSKLLVFRRGASDETSRRDA